MEASASCAGLSLSLFSTHHGSIVEGAMIGPSSARHGPSRGNDVDDICAGCGPRRPLAMLPRSTAAGAAVVGARTSQFVVMVASHERTVRGEDEDTTRIAREDAGGHDDSPTFATMQAGLCY